MEKQKETQIKVVYKHSPDYKEIPVSGAWGGITGQGYVHAALYLEHSSNPDEMTLQINEDGTAIEKDRKPESHAVRELMVGMCMRPEVARVIGEWLVKKAEELEKVT